MKLVFFLLFSSGLTMPKIWKIGLPLPIKPTKWFFELECETHDFDHWPLAKVENVQESPNDWEHPLSHLVNLFVLANDFLKRFN